MRSQDGHRGEVGREGGGEGVGVRIVCSNSHLEIAVCFRESRHVDYFCINDISFYLCIHAHKTHGGIWSFIHTFISI